MSWQIMPGSTRVLNWETGTLEACSADTCPHAIDGVNHAPFAAFGGWGGGMAMGSAQSTVRTYDGGTLVLDHGHGISSNFLHLSRIDAKVGDTVTLCGAAPADGTVIGEAAEAVVMKAPPENGAQMVACAGTLAGWPCWPRWPLHFTASSSAGASSSPIGSAKIDGVCRPCQ